MHFLVSFAARRTPSRTDGRADERRIPLSGARSALSAESRLDRSTVAGAAFVPLLLAWLTPNHYLPWLAFHADWLAAAAFLLLLASCRLQDLRIGVSLLAVGGMLVACIPLLQFGLGLVAFAGDAVMASSYIAGWSLCVVCGAVWMRTSHADLILRCFAAALLVAALASSMIALGQWLELFDGSIYVVDVATGSRPFANLGQPNHLATLLVLGVVAALLLHQRDALGSTALAACATVLCIGIATTQSRTAFLQSIVLVGWLLCARRRVGLRVGYGAIVITLAACVVFMAAWPWLNEALGLSSGSTMSERGAKGVRSIHWLSLLDAMAREPWSGYGWNQVSVAQMRVALDHPAPGEVIEHSHNLILDLLIWNGVPLGVLIVGALVCWFYRQFRACRDASVALLLAGVGIVVTHAMVEYPMDYAYFLFPVGFMMGAAESLSAPARSLYVPARLIKALAACAGLLMLFITIEYVQIENNHRQLRFEAARIGAANVESEIPQVVLLTQLREFLRLARSEARPEMTAAQVDEMRRIAERYPLPPVLLRYALVTGLNGRPDLASATLVRLCKMHTNERCGEGREAWSVAMQRYPVLAEVPFPVRTGSRCSAAVTRPGAAAAC